ncbi:MAG: hypothetical protein ACKO1H_08405 [Tabrizicola sp.]
MTQGPTALTDAVDARLAVIAQGAPGPARLEAQLRQLAKWRSQVLANTIAARMGDVVPAGPFAGMRYPVQASEGGRAPRLLGAYEASLHPILETVIARAYPQVIDIGAAEGYYAVGLARRMPGTTVHARDTDPRARALCTDLAKVNGVGPRVLVGPEVTHADLALCAHAETFILCDIEGAEGELLDPARAPELAQADILVEVHEGMRPGLLSTLTQRFAPSHRVTRIDRALRPDLLPDWAEGLSDLDRLLLLWEWRASPTPWLWMERL